MLLLCALLAMAAAGAPSIIYQTNVVSRGNTGFVGIPGGLYQRNDFDQCIGTKGNVCNAYNPQANGLTPNPACGNSAACMSGLNISVASNDAPPVPANDLKMVSTTGWFVFPFATTSTANCLAGNGCPSLASATNPNPIASNALPAGDQGRAVYLATGDTISFNFEGPIGALGLQVASTTAGTFAVTFDQLSTIASGAQATFAAVTGSVNVNTTASTGGSVFQPLWLSTKDATTAGAIEFQPGFNRVTLTWNSAGTWFVVSDLFWGQIGANCQKNFASGATAGVAVDLRELPQADGVFNNGVDVYGNSSALSINELNNQNVGGYVVVLCFPPGVPYEIRVRDNHVDYSTAVDCLGNSGNLVCQKPHSSDPYASCWHDPRAKFTVPLRCLPNSTDADLTIGLYQSSDQVGGFREIAYPDNLDTPYTVYVLAVDGVYASIKVAGADTPAPFQNADTNCRKDCGALAQSCAPQDTYISNFLVYRALCPYFESRTYPFEGLPFPEDPLNGGVSTINATVWFSWQYWTIAWELEEMQNKDTVVCLPTWGVFEYQATEINLYNGVNRTVTTEVANTNCSPSAQQSQCNGTPQNLVGVLEEPEVCRQQELCDNRRSPKVWAGANETGFALTLSHENTTFRNYYVDPYVRYGVCVLNLNRVTAALAVPTVREALSTELTAVYDCTLDGGPAGNPGATPGTCAWVRGVRSFFSILKVDALHLPETINYAINYVIESEEGGCNVCSSATLLNGIFCREGNEVEYICVPAIGSADRDVDCSFPSRPERLDLVAEECPPELNYTSHNECLLNATGRNESLFCNDPADYCIQKTVALDCRTDGVNCTATLAQELSVFELLSLPSAITVSLLPPVAPAYNPGGETAEWPVRQWFNQGGCPQSYWVLCGSMRVRLNESDVTILSDVIDCSTAESCVYSEFLSMIDLAPAITYDGELRLEDVTVYIGELPDRPGVSIGANCVRCYNRKVAVLAGQSYNLTFEWIHGTYDRWLVTECNVGPCNKCTPLPSLVRWFAVDPTCPTQSVRNEDCSYTNNGAPYQRSTPHDEDATTQESRRHDDVAARALPSLCWLDEDTENLNPLGDVFPEIYAAINDDYAGKLVTMPFTERDACNVPALPADQKPYQIYYVLAKSDASDFVTVIDGATPADQRIITQSVYDITIQQGCAGESFELWCGVDSSDTGISGCPLTCQGAPQQYSDACVWAPLDTERGAQLPLGPPQSAIAGVCPSIPFDVCDEPWYALKPLVTINVDLRCLPDGSSDLSDSYADNSTPDDGTQETDFRGFPYVNHNGNSVPGYYNPIDISICCGTCADQLGVLNQELKLDPPLNMNCTGFNPNCCGPKDEQPEECQYRKKGWTSRGKSSRRGKSYSRPMGDVDSDLPHTFNGCGDTDAVDYCTYEPTCVPGTSCRCPVKIPMAGGKQNLFCGLFSHTAGTTMGSSHYQVTVTERFQNEARIRFQQAEPQYPETLCNKEERDAKWDEGIEALRPSTCYSGQPSVNECYCLSPDGRSKVPCTAETTYDCSYTYPECVFVNRFDKPDVLNYADKAYFQSGVLQLTYTYHLKYIPYYLPLQANYRKGKFNRAYTYYYAPKYNRLLRPNRAAVPEDLGVCVLKDTFYKIQVNDLVQSASSSAFNCTFVWGDILKYFQEGPTPTEPYQQATFAQCSVNAPLTPGRPEDNGLYRCMLTACVPTVGGLIPNFLTSINNDNCTLIPFQDIISKKAWLPAAGDRQSPAK